MAETWIVFKADQMDSEGWELRKLLPSENLTDILSEYWSYSDTEKIPQVGDRAREYANISDPGNGISHGKDGDWVVTKICNFSSFDTDQRIVVCYCAYQPIGSENWQPLDRGLPVA